MCHLAESIHTLQLSNQEVESSQILFFHVLVPTSILNSLSNATLIKRPVTAGRESASKNAAKHIHVLEP